MSHSRTRVAAAAAAVAVGGALVVGLGTLGIAAVHTGATAPATAVAAAAPLAAVAPARAPVSAAPATSTSAPPTTTTTTTTTSAAASTTTTPPAPVGTVPGIPCSLPAVGDGACVQLSTQKAWLVTDGKVALAVSATTGKSGSTTPVGHFSVLYKDIDHRSKEFDNAPRPYSVFFYPGDAFHTGSLRQRSNGCVHLGSSAARTFYNTLQNGDPVQVVR